MLNDYFARTRAVWTVFSPLGKLGTANRDLYRNGMSMLGC